MADKLISLSELQEYKTYADAKYQDKITAGSNIFLSDNTISHAGSPSFSGNIMLGNREVANNTLTELDSITLQPGIYVLIYTCLFPATNGCVQCGFSTNTTDITGFGVAYMDSASPVTNTSTQTRVSAIFEISAADYPNGRKFYFLAYQKNSGSTVLNVTPRALYFKF